MVGIKLSLFPLPCYFISVWTPLTALLHSNRYYINIHTRQSHWERPDQPAPPAGPVPPPEGAPPSREATTTTTPTTTRDRPVGHPNPEDHDLPEVYTPQPSSQSAYAPNAPNPGQGYHSYSQSQHRYDGYSYNPTYSPYPAYPNQYPNPYQNTYDQSQPPYNQTKKKGLGKKIAAALGLGGGLVSGILLGEST